MLLTDANPMSVVSTPMITSAFSPVANTMRNPVAFSIKLAD